MILSNRVIIAILFVSLLLCQLCICDDAQNVEYMWKPLVDIPTTTFEGAFLPSYIDFSNDVLQSEAVSDQCKSDIYQALHSLRLRQTWAVQLFNSWGKLPPAGLARGTLTDFGDYDQCLSIVRPLTPQYCLVDISLPMPALPVYHNYHQKTVLLPDNDTTQLNAPSHNITFYRHLQDKASVFFYVYLKVGICLPKSCSKNDINVIASKNVKKLGLSVRNIQCEVRPTKLKLNYVQIGAISTLAVIVTLTLISAIYDRLACKQSEFKFKFLLWFSPARNVRKLLFTKSLEDELACVHGLRFVTIVWIIMAHTLEWNSLNIYRDTFMIPERLSQANLQFLYKAFYCVETFFYLSGLLTSYVTLKFTGGQYRNFKYSEFIVLRYLRLTPQLFLFLLLTSLLPVMFDGPIWQGYMAKLSETCYKNWWLDLLYLQNIFDIANICAVHTWYLAADMQLHWMSLVAVVFLLMHRQRGILFANAILVVCTGISAAMIAINRFPPGHIITSKNDFLDEQGMPSEFVAFLYKPWNHASVFFIGFIFGAYIPNAKNMREIAIKKTTKYLLWLIVLGGYFFCILSTLPYVQGRPYDYWSAVIFPLNRIIWALMLSLLVWLCVTNNGGIAGRLLSWNGFKPFSRMTYCIYLTHAWILYIALGTRRQLIEMNTTAILLHFGGIILLSFIVGFIFNLLVETPIINALECYKNFRRHHKHQPLTNKKANGYDVNGNLENENGKQPEKWKNDIKLVEIRSS